MKVKTLRLQDSDHKFWSQNLVPNTQHLLDALDELLQRFVDGILGFIPTEVREVFICSLRLLLS